MTRGLEVPKMLDRTPNFAYFLNERLVGDNMYAASLKFGHRVSAQERRDEIQHELIKAGMLNSLAEDALKMDDGVDHLWVNRLPEPEAENLTLDLGKQMMRRQLDVLGWDPLSVNMIAVGSSLAPFYGGLYSQYYADQLGMHNAKYLDIYAACSSGAVAYNRVLQCGGRGVIFASEAMLRTTMGFDPYTIDIGSGLIFSQGLVVMAFEAGKSMKLVGDSLLQEFPDTASHLAARTNYVVSPDREGHIIQETEHVLQVVMPVPPEGKLIWMHPRVGGSFVQNVGTAIGFYKLHNHFEMKDRSDEVWNSIDRILFHFPSKKIAEHLIRDLLKSGMLPPRVIRDKNQLELRQLLKTQGIASLGLPINPVSNPDGNAPAANMLSSLVDTLPLLIGKRVLVVGFGAGMTVITSVVDFA